MESKDITHTTIHVLLCLIMAWMSVGELAALTLKDINKGPNGEYLIGTKEELGLFRDEFNYAGVDGRKWNVRLTADITFSPREEWTPIGTSGHAFGDTFDGDGHVISGLFVQSDPDATEFLPMGFIIYVRDGAKIRNLGFLNGKVQSLHSGGGIVGSAEGEVTFENCFFQGEVTGTDAVGGIVGSLSGFGNQANVNNCYNEATVKTDGTGGQASAGGIAGRTDASDFKNCYNKGMISGVKVPGNNETEFFVGALVGNGSDSSTKFVNCFYIGADKAVGTGTTEGTIKVDTRSSASAEAMNQAGFKGGNSWWTFGAGYVNGEFIWPQLSVFSRSDQKVTVNGLPMSNKNDEAALLSKIIVSSENHSSALKKVTLMLDDLGTLGDIYEFQNWKVVQKGTEIPVDITVAADKKTASFTMPAEKVIITANFTKAKYMIFKKVTVDGERVEDPNLEGLIEITPSEPKVANGDPVTLKIPETGDWKKTYAFVGWTMFAHGLPRMLKSTPVITENPYTFTMPIGPVTVVANFKTYHKVDLQFAVGEKGKDEVIVKKGDALYPTLRALISSDPVHLDQLFIGDQVKLTANSSSAYKFVLWKEDNEPKNVKDITMGKSDRVITAKYYSCEKKVDIVVPQANDLVYDGTPKEIDVNLNGVPATEGFSVSYDDNVNVGMVTATILFTDPSVKEKKQIVTFNITPKDLTVTPDAGQRLYAGGDDYEFSYKYAGEVAGEKPAFKGALKGENGKIKIGSLHLVDGKYFLAKNYTLKLDEVGYTQSDKDINQALEEAFQGIRVIGTLGDNGWYIGESLRFLTPKGFELAEEEEWTNDYKYEYQGERTVYFKIRRERGKYSIKRRYGVVKYDRENPTIALDHTHSLSAYFSITDDASGVASHSFDTPSVSLRAASDWVVWRGKAGVNKVTLRATDQAGNVAVEEFTVNLEYIGWNVILPENPLAYIVPDPGIYEVEDGESFVFRLDPRRGYDFDHIRVSIDGGDILNGVKGRYTIPSVTSNLKINIAYYSPVDNEDIEISEFNVRASQGAIVIATPQPTQVQIIDFNGRVLRSVQAQAGTTYCTGFSKGAYIVRSDLGVVKIVL